MKKTLLIVVAVLFAVSLVGIAFAESDLSTYRGEVVAVDHFSKTLTVRANESAVSPLLGGEESISAPLGSEGAFTFSTDGTTGVHMCNMSRDFSSITVGDQVNIMYGEGDSGYIAKFVDILAPIVACNIDE